MLEKQFEFSEHNKSKVQYPAIHGASSHLKLGRRKSKDERFANVSDLLVWYISSALQCGNSTVAYESTW